MKKIIFGALLAIAVALPAMGQDSSLLGYVSDGAGGWIPWAAIAPGGAPSPYPLRSTKLYCQSGSTIAPCDPGAIGSTNPYNNGTTFQFGDSTNTIGNSHASVPQTSGAALYFRDLLGNDKQPYAASGTLAGQIAANELTYFVPPVANVAYQLPKVFANGGINDANTCSSAACLANYSAQQRAGLAWMLMPTANKIMASTATQSGFSSSATIPLQASIVGTAMKSTTIASTITFTGTTAGTKVGLTWITTAASGGTFTVTVNGASVNGCSGTATWAANGCGAAVGFNSPMRQDFTVTPGAYTIAVTVTSATNAANPVEILDADSSPATIVNQAVVFQMGVIKQNADANSAATAAYNTSAAATVTALAAENLNVHFVDLRGGSPGVNSTTDMAATSLACPSNSNTPLHPNDCGYAHLVQTLELSVASAGYRIFFPNVGSSVGPQIMPYGIRAIAPNSTTSWKDSMNSNASNGVYGGGAPTATNISPIWCSFPLPGVDPNASHISCTGLLFDPATSGFGVGVVADFDMVYLSCPTNNLNYTGCTVRFKVDKTTGATSFPAQISTGTKFTASGCSNGTLVGGASAGRYTSGTTGTCTVVITPGITAPNGWTCKANDLTTPADTINQTATTTTTATLSGTTVTGDLVNFACTGY